MGRLDAKPEPAETAASDPVAAEPDLAAWTESCRLNPSRGATDHFDDPAIQTAFTTLVTYTGPAIQNLAQLTT